MKNIKVTDEYFVNAQRLESRYLKDFQPDKLLSGFLTTKGLSPKVSRYGGWESSAIAGHTLGHYLTAVAQMYGQLGDAEFLDTLSYMIDELVKAQHDNGYLGAILENDYDKLETGNASGTWVPWYTMHKIITGLVSVYLHTKNPKALEVVSKLGDWVAERTSKWSEEVQNKVLSIEYGGMNDCMYELYKLTGSRRHLNAAHAFDEISLLTPMSQGRDILNNKHANTTIPKFVGALNRYRALGEGEEFYLQAATNFWDIVVDSHTYVTGGNSEWEHFGEAKVLDAERTECNCETCNTYNMLKLTRELFKITMDVKYADFYENTFINAILSSQDPETGMTTYFQPMASGYFKVYSSRFDHFWCCTGSGMENFSKLNDSIYFHDGKEIYVNQYVSSVLEWGEKNIRLTQSADFKNSDVINMIINTLDSSSADINLRIRIPDWISGEPVLKVNGRVVKIRIEKGYLLIDGSFDDGTTIEISLPMEVKAYPLPDNKDVTAFKYGPYVLSAGLGSDDMKTGTTGVNVTIPLKGNSVNEKITVLEGTKEEWLDNITENMVKKNGNLEFILRGTDSELIFSPHYLKYKGKYGIYWKISEAVKLDSEEMQTEILTQKENGRLKNVIIDNIPISNDQYELHHNLKAVSSTAGSFKGYNYRDAGEGGWFSYDLGVSPEGCNRLMVKYCSGDAGRTFEIYADDILIQDEVIQNDKMSGFYDKYYDIPNEAVDGKEKVTIRFQAKGKSCAGGIFDNISIIGGYGTNASLTDIYIENGIMESVFSCDVTEYNIITEKDAEMARYKVSLSEAFGLLYEGDVLINDSILRSVKLTGDETVIELTVKAEDHKTSRCYRLKFIRGNMN